MMKKRTPCGVSNAAAAILPRHDPRQWTASTFIYEAVALGPAALRVNDWVAGIVQGGNAEQESMRDMTAIAVGTAIYDLRSESQHIPYEWFPDPVRLFDRL